jgi:hypothetical protein
MASVSGYDPIAHFGMLNWNYESMRVAQRVADGLQQVECRMRTVHLNVERLRRYFLLFTDSDLPRIHKLLDRLEASGIPSITPARILSETCI